MADQNNSTVMLSPQRNVTFAVNYEASNCGFWQNNASRKPNSGAVENVPEPTANSNPNDAGLAAGSSSTSDDGVTKKDNNPTMESSSSDGLKKDNPPQKDDDPEKENPAKKDPPTTKDSAPKAPVEAAVDETVQQTPETTSKAVASTSLSDEDANSCKENNKKAVTIKTPATAERQRRSTREPKKKDVPVERTRVRYDMELVPAVKRNRAFLDRFPLWMTPSSTREEKIKRFQYRQQTIIKEHQQKLMAAQKQPLEEKKQPFIDEQGKAEPVAKRDNGWVVPHKQQGVAFQQDADDMSPELVDDEMLTPFEDDNSVIWVPKKRSEWEDSVLEMTAVCTSASLRRHLASGKAPSTKPFHAPLSKEYIRDRVDIDDPLNGYQIRHKTGGWLQGFILWTNFTTWTHYFKWDSSHAMSGIPTMNTGANSSLVDSDGSLALELEHQPRSGDPFEGGVVFEAVAEISLVGGLGCGEYLLRMALDSIRMTRKYKFVVLQATDSSKTFYERFGFVRVGAICRYERRDKDPTKPGVRPDTPIMGYRHWTHPNESDTSLQKHGGPSYMMCLKLPEDPPDMVIETPFLDEMMKLEVAEKPTIEQLGGTSTPYPKQRRGSIDSADAQFPPRNTPRKKGSRGRRTNSGSPATSISGSSLSQVFTSGAKSPPSLPVLKGSGSSTNPTQAKGGTRSGGVKRSAETSGNENSAPKKRRVSAATDESTGQGTTGTRRNTTDNQETKPLRRTPRDRSGNGAESADLAGQSIHPSEAAAEAKKPGGKKIDSKSVAKRSTPRRNSGPATVASSASAAAAAVVDKNASPSSVSRSSGPMKQKVKSYPRDRVHFYNKVVRPKKGKKTENFFVLHYDEAKQTIRIIPMEPRGILSGKRAGRPRFQAVMTNIERDAKTVRCADYEIVKAFMVMKTPVVASEAWDVLDAP